MLLEDSPITQLPARPPARSPRLTPEQVKALERHWAAQEARERMRTARIKHGLYSKRSGEAIRALGEKPEDLEQLIDSLIETWRPQGEYEGMLVRRLARALWRLERADHAQESMSVSQAEIMARRLREHAAAESAAHKRKMKALEWLLDRAQKAGFLASGPDLDVLQEFYGLKPAGRPRQICYRVFRLLPAAEGATPLALAEGSQALVPAGDGGQARNELEPAQNDQREQLRDELCLMLREEIEALTVEHRRVARRARQESPAQRDACLVPSHPEAQFVLRVESSSFRQIDRLTHLLMKVQKARQDREALEQEQTSKNDECYPYLIENKRSS